MTKRIEYTVVLEVEHPYELEWYEQDLTSWVRSGVTFINQRRMTGATIVGTSIGTIGES
jgi:hypothetical protein